MIAVRSLGILGFLCALVVGLGLASPSVAHAQDTLAPPSGEGLKRKIAVLSLEPLGMAPEPVARLEALFRMELQRLAGKPLPTARQIKRAIRRNRRLRRCSGNNRCLAAIGRKLGVEIVVAGNVAQLGDSYLVNIKAVDVRTRRLLRRIEEPLRGNPNELISRVRVAAYSLLLPKQLVGGIMILTDLKGAKVTVDGKPMGTTPLKKALGPLPRGDHKLVITAKGYHPFEETVKVRFQKTTRVLMRLSPIAPKVPLVPLITKAPIIKKRPAKKHWYNKTWFYVAAGATAVIFGAIVGHAVAHDPIIDCSANPSICSGM